MPGQKVSKKHRRNGPRRGGSKQGGKKAGRKRVSLRDSYFVRPLTGKAYKQERRAAEREQFRPQQRELQGEVRAEAEQRRRIADYFDAYGKEVDKAAAATKTAYASALSNISSQSKSATVTDAAERAKVEAEAQADAKLRSATYKPSEASVQAAASRRTSNNVAYGFTAARGASQSAYIADTRRIGEGERVNQLMLSHKRSRSLSQDERDLAKARSDFRKDYRARTRESEREFYFNQANKRQNAQQLKASTKADKSSQKSQMRLARRYGKNSKREQNRSLRNQMAVLEQQAQNETLSKAQAAKLARLTARLSNRNNAAQARRYPQQKAGKGGGGGSDYYTVNKAIARLKTATGKYNDVPSARAYLRSSGFPANIARTAVARLLSRGNTSVNAALHGG